MRTGARTRLIDISVIALATALAVLAVFAHGSGHVSMDSSEQLYEAAIGRSVSWSPPFMSALLRLLGGGSQATTIFVVACVGLTYGGALLAYTAGRRGTAAPFAWPVRVLAIGLLIANPLIFLHVGIVWKDVLLAALLSASAGMLLLASHRGGRSGTSLAVFALALLVPLLLVRQQGILLAPPLVAVAAAMIAGMRIGWGGVRWWMRWTLVVLVFVIACSVSMLGARNMIKGTGDKSTAVGFAAVQRYDLTGMLATGNPPADGLTHSLMTPAFQAAVRRSYSADRIDFVLNDPGVVEGFWGLQPEDVTEAYWAQIRARPIVYLQVKADQFAWLLGLHRIDKCLPLHLGVEGNPDYLKVAGIDRGMDDHDLQLYQLGLWSRHLVFYRHWFYLAVLLLSGVYLVARWRRGDLPGAPVAGALWLGLSAFYGAYAATSIACDFRYLYPGLVGSSILAIYLLAAGPPRHAHSEDTRA